MVDVHSHILPEVDDGSKSWEMTAEMCKIAAEDGITHIVATPHANEEFAYDRAAHTASVERLRQIAPQLSFSLGCDFHMSYDNIEDALLHPTRYVIENTRYLLVEFSDFSIPSQMANSLFRLRGGGFTPIVTHPERNPQLLRHMDMVLQWAESGCVIQVTANSLSGFWGKTSQQAAEWLLKRDAVHVIASDAHEPKRRVPRLSKGRDLAARLVGSDVAEALVAANPRAIVDGLPLPYMPQPETS